MVQPSPTVVKTTTTTPLQRPCPPQAPRPPSAWPTAACSFPRPSRGNGACAPCGQTSVSCPPRSSCRARWWPMPMPEGVCSPPSRGASKRRTRVCPPWASRSAKGRCWRMCGPPCRTPNAAACRPSWPTWMHSRPSPSARQNDTHSSRAPYRSRPLMPRGLNQKRCASAGRFCKPACWRRSRCVHRCRAWSVRCMSWPARWSMREKRCSRWSTPHG